MSLRDYYAGIPLVAVEEEYVMPPELGGRRANYPMVCSDQQYGLFNEVVTDWYGPGSQLYEAVTGQPDQTRGDVATYSGEVWSIQLTARPGFYVTPQQLEIMGLGYMDDDPYNP